MLVDYILVEGLKALTITYAAGVVVNDSHSAITAAIGEFVESGESGNVGGRCICALLPTTSIHSRNRFRVSKANSVQLFGDRVSVIKTDLGAINFSLSGGEGSVRS